MKYFTWAVAALPFFLLMIGYFLWHGYQHAIVEAENETHNLVVVLESRLSSELAHVEGMLTFIADDVKSDPFHSRSAAVSATKTQNLVRMVKSFPKLAGLFVFDADGTMQMTSDPNVKPFSIADRPHFKTLRDHPNTSLVFSEPILSRSTGKWSLIQARAIRDDAGRFLGTVNAVLHIDTFLDLFRSTDIGQNGGSILIRRSDNFKLIARIPVTNEKDFDRHLPLDYPIRQRLESGARQGTLAFTANTDGVRRIGSFSRLDDRFPFYVQVALSEDHYLAEWRQQVLWTGLLLVPLLLAFGVALFHLRLNITLRNQAELDQKRENQKNKALLRSASDGITVLDEYANVVDVSDSFCTMLGYSRDEMIGMNLTNWDCKFNSQDELMAAVRQQFQSQASSLFQSRHRRKDGSIFDVEINLQSIDLEDHRVVYGSHRDITERIQAKNLLKEEHKALLLSEAQVAISQRIGGTGSFVYDFNTDIVHASTQMLRIFGLPASVAAIALDDFLACASQHRELVRQTLAGKFGFPIDIADYPLDDVLAGVSEQDPIHKTLADLINQSHEYDGECVIQPADGSQPKVIHAIGKLERDSQGTPIKILGFVQDITERKRVEKANTEMMDRLAQLNQRFLLAADSAHIGVWDYFVQENRLVWDPWMYALYGLREEAFTGAYDTWQSGLHAEDKERGDLEIGQALRGDKDFDTEFRVVWPSGEVRHIKANAVVVRDPSGNPLRMIGVNYDITDRKRLEDRVRDLAFYDPLTHLANRRLLDDRLGQVMASCKRSACHAAVMVLDLDHFKPLNDQHGHLVGDMLLIEAAKRLGACMRQMDTVARFGGDEFVVILGELDADRAVSTTQAMAVAEKIRAALSQIYVLHVTKPSGNVVIVDHHCTASIGVVVLSDHEATQDDILKWADGAMYLAKDAGRNAIRLCVPPPRPSVTRGMLECAGAASPTPDRLA